MTSPIEDSKVNFETRRKTALEKFRNFEFKPTDPTVRILLINYAFATAKIIGEGLFSTIKPRRDKEMMWLQEAAKCMNFKIKDSALRKEIKKEDLDEAYEDYNKAIAMLCWIDIMLDDLIENVRTPEELSIAIEFTEEVERIMTKKADDQEGELEKIQCDPRLLKYADSIELFIEKFFFHMGKLPPMHKPAKDMIKNGVKSLTESLIFSGAYRLQMEADPVETIKLYTQGKEAKKAYIQRNSGNMAMGIMLGMFSTLIREDSAATLTPLAHQFSEVGRLGNDCATGVGEIKDSQMNGIIYWATACGAITAEEAKSFSKGLTSEIEIKAKLQAHGVFDQILTTRDNLLEQLVKQIDTNLPITKEDTENLLNQLLELELLRY